MTTYVTLDEAAGILRIHRDTLTARLQEHKIPGAFKIGRQWRIPRAAVEPPEFDILVRGSRGVIGTNSETLHEFGDRPFREVVELFAEA